MLPADAAGRRRRRTVRRVEGPIRPQGELSPSDEVIACAARSAAGPLPAEGNGGRGTSPSGLWANASEPRSWPLTFRKTSPAASEAEETQASGTPGRRCCQEMSRSEARPA
ncbi:hypothetical protein DIPPA_35968 [Diplonema papillatum]|nr:hypothetical protein DIPPA_35968 [Diplonema papillatum]